MSRLLLLTTVAACALGASATAYAQSTPVRSDASMIDEVVVTAQRRTENLQEVPVSVTALSADTLASAAVVSSQDLTVITPGLTFSRSSVNAQPTIRGIGTRNAGPGDEPNVATYIDGVYQAEQYANFQEFSNIERIEVLKGPQGTLFGRNATGGAINLITKKPSFKPTGDVAYTYGRFNYNKLTGYVSGPLIADKLAASLTGFTIREENYVRNVFLNTTSGDRKSDGVRAKLLFTPTAKMEFELNGFHANSKDQRIYDGTPVNGNSQARRLANPTNIPLSILIPNRPLDAALSFIPFSKVNQTLIDAHMSIDLGWATLSGLLSGAQSKNVSRFDLDSSPLPTNDIRQRYGNRSYNQELVLTSNGEGRFEWLVGVNGFQANATLTATTVTPTSILPTPSSQRSAAAAAFAEGTYALTDKLFVTGGLRYSWDRKEGANFVGVVTRGEKSWTNISPRLVLRYEFMPRANVYASYTQGFKTGTFNPTTAAGATIPAQPETVDAYEVGVKADVLPNLRINAAAFHYSYNDLQTSLTVLQPSGAVVSLLQNAPEATVNGFEATLDWEVVEDLRVNAGVSLLDTEIGRFPNAAISVPFLVGGLPAGNTQTTGSVTGNRLIRAPDRTFNLGFSYDHDLFDGTITLAGNAFWSSKYFGDLLNRTNQPAYQVVNGSVSWASPGDRYKISVFGQNLTDERYAQAITGGTFGDTIQYYKPRWFGVTLGYAF